jgi:hypothetical protein
LLQLRESQKSLRGNRPLERGGEAFVTLLGESGVLDGVLHLIDLLMEARGGRRLLLGLTDRSERGAKGREGKHLLEEDGGCCRKLKMVPIARSEDIAKGVRVFGTNSPTLGQRARGCDSEE